MTMSRKIIKLNENTIHTLKDDISITKKSFINDIIGFLIQLINDPITAKVSTSFNMNGLDRDTLINVLLEYNIIVKYEGTNNVIYKVPSENFRIKLEKLYSEVKDRLENRLTETDVDEAISAMSSGAFVAPLFSYPTKMNKPIGKLTTKRNKK